MDDDMLLDRLRRLGDAEPPVTIDRSLVLRTGRRRRLARRVGSTAVVLAVAVGAYPAVAAMVPDHEVAPPAETATATATPRAVVDHEAGTITLPMDELIGDPEDWSTTATARAHFMAVCMDDAGFGEHWELDGPVRQAAWMSLPYGVWRESDVREVGYEPLLEMVTAAEGARTLGDLEVQAYERCLARQVTAGLDIDLDALRAEHGPEAGSWTSGSETAEGAIYGEWRQCLVAQGVEPPGEVGARWMPAGVQDAPLEEQIRIGLIDVGCKDRLDTVQRMADVDAAVQAAALERDAEYYAALRPLEQAVLESARQYVDEHDLMTGE